MVALELVEEHPLLLRRRELGERRQVEEQHQHPGPLDVAEELVAEAPALGGALDQPGRSATTNSVSSSSRTTPRFGSSVVNG